MAATQAATKFTVEMTKERDTKNTYRYDTADEAAGVTSVYVQKSAFKGAPPEKITLTVEG